jgi:hypothetical protein
MSIVDNLEEVADIIKKAGDIELYRKIVKLEGAIIELTREKMKLEEQNADLQKLLNAKQEMKFNKPFYYQENDPHPFCPQCWEADKKAVHLDGPQEVVAGPRYDCPSCRNTFIHPRRDPRSYPKAETDFSPF